jgi:hypothetical protein
MQPHAKKLQDSLAGFIASMNTENVKFRARLLPFSSVVAQLEGSSVRVAERTFSYRIPKGLDVGLDSADLMPDYEERNQSQIDLYAKSVVLGNASSAAEIAAGIAKAMAAGTTELENEPGVCLAMDFLAWQKAATGSLGKHIHIVALSTEDNSRSFDDFDRISGAVTKSNALFCGVKAGIAKACTTPSKYTWKRAGTPSTKYGYKVDYTYNKCGNANVGMALVDLREKKAWEQPRFSCKENVVSGYQCVAGAHVVQRGDGGLSGKIRVKAASRFECDVLIDNFPAKAQYDWAKADAHMRGGGKCVAEGGSPARDFDASPADVDTQAKRDRLGYFSHLSFACTAQRSDLTRTNLTPTQKDEPKWLAGSCVQTHKDQRNTWEHRNGAYQRTAQPSGYVLGDRAQPLRIAQAVCASAAPSDSVAAAGWLEKVNVGSAQAQTKSRDYNDYSQALGASAEAALKARFQGDYSSGSNAWIGFSGPTGLPQQASDIVATTTSPTPPTGWPTSAKPSSVETCEGLSGTDSDTGLLAPTPENFSQFAREKLPDVQISWHAIVSRSAQSCQGSQGSHVEGKDYVALAEKSGGIVQDVCAPNFDSFTDRLARFSLEVPVLSHPLPEALAKLDAAAIVVMVNGARLGVDKYAVSAGRLVFGAGAVKKDDAIKVTQK